MKTIAWCWLALLAIPGCLLVQPLDDAKPKDEDSAGSAGKAAQAGGAGQHTGGSPGTGGTGNKAGAGPLPPGGSANGGGSNGVDFSLFTGTWTTTGGSRITTCDGAAPETAAVTPGGTDTIGLGTISDLIFGPDTVCEILADVDDRSATLNYATAECSYSDDAGEYQLSFDEFEFVVSGDSKTAKLAMSTTIFFTDIYDEAHVCYVDSSLDYER